MRVLLIATDYPPTTGGIQTLLREFVTRSRHEIRVVAPADPGHQAVDSAIGTRTRRVRGVSATGSRRGFVPSLFVGALREAAGWKPDVVLAGHVLAAPGGLWLRRTRKMPLVVMTYGVELVAPRAARVARWVLPNADRVIAVSGFTMDAARALGAKGGDVIPVGAPSPREIDSAAVEAFRARFGLDKHKTLLTVARLEAHKGIDVVINALPSLPEDVMYLIVGGGLFQPQLEDAARRRGIAHRVVFSGRLSDDDLAVAYSAADVFVLASRSLDGGRGGVEGCPVSLLEASAYGLPIVAGRSGGIADAVIDGITGLLANPESQDEIVEALKKALDVETGRALGTAAAQMASTTRSWASVVAKIDASLEATR